MPAAGEPRRVLAMAGRAAGVVTALGAGMLWWMFLFRNPYAEPAAGGYLLLGLLMIVTSAMATVAAARGAHLGMYLLFMVSFVPQGLTTLFGPAVFQAIGWLNLAYLASAALVHVSVRRRPSERAGATESGGDPSG